MTEQMIEEVVEQKRPKVIAIIAAALDGAIGIGDKLPWSYKNDLTHFKETTQGHSILMGSSTYRALGKTLPGRKVFVLSRDPEKKFKSATTVTSFEEFLELNKNEEQVFIAGGKQVYELTEEFWDEMICTVIQAIFPNATVHWRGSDKTRWMENKIKHPRKFLENDKSGLSGVVMYLQRDWGEVDE